MLTYGVPDEVLTDNGKQFTGKFGTHTAEVLFDRMCRENGISHRLTAPRSPTTTGKIERFHQSVGTSSSPTAPSTHSSMHSGSLIAGSPTTTTSGRTGQALLTPCREDLVISVSTAALIQTLSKPDTRTELTPSEQSLQTDTLGNVLVTMC
jgi:hypothetical protein